MPAPGPIWARAEVDKAAANSVVRVMLLRRVEVFMMELLGVNGCGMLV
jgi:hypothetical protein